MKNFIAIFAKISPLLEVGLFIWMFFTLMNDYGVGHGVVYTVLVVVTYFAVRYFMAQVAFWLNPESEEEEEEETAAM